MTDVLNVAIIGGSPTAKQLIVDFISRPFVNVVGVADVDSESPAAQVAQRYGIPFTTDIHDFADLEPTPDILIDVCGKPHVHPAIDETFPSIADGGPSIIYDTVARLLISIAADAATLAPTCRVFSENPRKAS
jgi:hypothetical protein